MAIAPILVGANPTGTNITSPAMAVADDNFAAWGRFCDDTYCSTNCGEWVDLANSGCLANEGGRQSLLLKSNGPDTMFALVCTFFFVSVAPSQPS